MRPGGEDDIDGIIRKIAYQDDQEAFRQFFDIYYHRLLNFAYFILESSVASEEVVSTVFISLWKKRKKLPEINRIEAYLFTSTKNKSYNYIRNNKRITQFKAIDSDKDFLVPQFENPETEMLSKEFRDKIIEIIEELPPKCKMIFTLIREDGMKYKEVAELLEISTKTVEVQMGRALTKIRTSIKPYLHEVELFHLLTKEKIKGSGKK